MKRVRFPNISPRAWEHPADRAALSALQKIPGLDVVLQQTIGATQERSLRLVALASAVRVSERQFAKVHTLYREACSVLDVQKPPELFIASNPFVNARAVGVKNPFIILNSSLLETLSDEELLFVIAHELGHCLSGHVLYSTVLVMLTNVVSPLLMSIPLGNAAVMAIRIALQEWQRKSELSCDRAALLVVQNPDVSYTVQMKIAGGKHVEQMNINEFFQQAFEYESHGDLMDSMHKIINLLGESHPFPVLRLVELKKWVDSGEYARVLSGGYASGGVAAAQQGAHYTERGNERNEDVFSNIKAAAQRYKDDLAHSEDPLLETLSDVADLATDAAKAAANKARQTFETLRKQR
jgi:Zn-dependent protease with chaperone function